MAYINPESPIIERTEASFHDRRSAGLLQKTEQGLKPSHFISCTMADTEKKDIYKYISQISSMPDKTTWSNSACLMRYILYLLEKGPSDLSGLGAYSAYVSPV